MRLIYIVGMGRSGSTLLDLLLDAHSNVRSLGGVRRMARALHSTPCACGIEPRMACPFWQAIEAELQQTLGVGLDGLEIHARDDATFRAHNHALFSAAARIAGVDYVVDSSKSVARLRRLLHTTDLDIRPIHIERDPRGYAYSQHKRKAERVAPAVSYVGRSLRAYRLLRNRSHAAVDYDDLTHQTEDNLRALMPRLDLAFESEQLAWADAVHHNVGGGAVLRRTKGSSIQPDYAWQRNLGPATQAAIQVLSWPGRVANRVKARRWNPRER